MILHYLDNAATTFPKPPEVADAMTRALAIAGSPGRGSGSGAREAESALESARAEVAALVGVSRERLAFTLNATDAIAMAVAGLAPPGARVVVSDIEHAAVMRPLQRREREGLVTLVRVTTRADGRIDPREIAEAARGASLVALTLASNVTGVVQPVEDVAALLPPETFLLVDAAQAAGSVAFDASAFGPRAVIALSAHKSLLGPMGCGALAAGAAVELPHWREGGTGDGEDEHPREMPRRLEAGTPPLPAILGLEAGVRWWKREGSERVRHREREQAGRLLDAVRSAGAPVTGPRGDVPIVSFSLPGLSPDEVAHVLEHEHGIAVRAGLHCAPSAHRRLGTWPAGLVRASVGPTTSDAAIDAFCDAMREMS